MEIDWHALPQAEAKALLRAGLKWRRDTIAELTDLDAPRAGRPRKNGLDAPPGDLDREAAGDA
jgi:hypothetical protein